MQAVAQMTSTCVGLGNKDMWDITQDEVVEHFRRGLGLYPPPEEPDLAYERSLRMGVEDYCKVHRCFELSPAEVQQAKASKALDSDAYLRQKGRYAQAKLAETVERVLDLLPEA